MRESATGPIHPGALPSGSGASGTAWELAGVSARQPSWSRFGCFQHPAGSKMCTSHFMEDIWMLVAPQSDWMQVCAPHVLPKPALNPDVPVHKCGITSCKSQVFAFSACLHAWSISWVFFFVFVFLVETGLPVFFKVSTLPWICIFVFLCFFCSLSQTRNRRLPDIYPQYCSSHHLQPDSHSLQGKMQGSLHSLLDVERKPP